MHRIAFTSERAERGAGDRAGRRAGAVPAGGLEPARTAHLVVDLQNGFMTPGAAVEVPLAREIVPNVNRISAALRAAGGTNVFLRMNLGTPATATWRGYLDRIPSPEDRSSLIAAFTGGAPSFELWDGLEVAEDDLVLDKTRFSAFVPGASRVHEELSRRGIDTLVVTGTLTNVCCESNARDAMQMDYRILFVADATAALSDETHNATLANMDSHFAEVLMTDELLAALPAPRGELARRRGDPIPFGS